jgi:hypothetical protein
MNQRRPLQAFTAGVLLLAAACSDQNEPVAPTAPESLSFQPTIQGTTDDPISLAQATPCFGGFYIDDLGRPVVYLKNAAERNNAARALAPFLAAHGLIPSQLRVLPARYDWVQLEGWFGQASAEVLALPGGVFVDADEARNRVTIGVERGASARIRGVVARLGIPQEAVVVRETEPIRLAATLRGKVRPVVGGLQINFPGLHPNVETFICSIGFNAVRNGQRSFITASHCTNHQGGVENTPYYQPLQTSTSPKIATEVSDPGYSPNKTGCPVGFRCRFSDASRAAYASTTTSSLGKIAKTTGPNNGSVTINGNFSITAEGSASVGQTVGKVGRTSGWTTGKVTNTCVDIQVTGTDIVQLCQNIVSARVRSGDSGAPVFKGSSNVTLAGMLWGCDCNQNGVGTLYAYSPISNIERELGALTTF